MRADSIQKTILNKNYRNIIDEKDEQKIYNESFGSDPHGDDLYNV